MNHIYKVIWSKAKHCYVVASEIAKSHGKSASAGKRALVAAVLAAAALTGAAMPAQAADNSLTLESVNEKVEALLQAGIVPGSNQGAGDNIVIGKGSSSNAGGTTIIGQNASAGNGTWGSVVLGNGSQVVYSDLQKTEEGRDQYGVVSVGKSGDGGFQRRIINVDNGITDTDAVNYGQLKETNNTVQEHTEVLEAYKKAGIEPGTIGADVSNSIALGEGSVVHRSAKKSMALGVNASVDDGVDRSIALGYGSQATEDKTVSVGNDTLKRRITNVEDGIDQTDVVNVRQLNTVSGAVNAVSERLTTVDMKVGNADFSGAHYVEGDSNVTQAIYDVDAQLYTFEAAGVIAGAAVEKDSQSMALGQNAVVAGDYSVALGADSVADRANTVSVGSEENQRQITNVAAGTEETDAVNVSQLKTTVGEATKGVVYWDDKDESKHTIQGVAFAGNGKLVAGSVTVDGHIGGFDVTGQDDKVTSYLHAGDLKINGTNSWNSAGLTADKAVIGKVTFGGEGKLTGVAAGTEDADAVNYGQLKATNDIVQSHTDVLAAYKAAGIVAGDIASGITGGISLGENSEAFGNAENFVQIGQNSFVDGKNSVAIGNGTVIGMSAENAVAIGANSRADDANTVSFGNADQTRRLTNISDGVNDTDAASFGQLKDVSGAVDAVDGKIGTAMFKRTNYAQGANNVTQAIYGVDAQVKGNTDSIIGLNSYTGYELSGKLNAGGATDLTTGVNNAYEKAEEAGTEAKKHTTVAAGDKNIKIENNGTDGQKEYAVSLAEDIEINSIKANSANIGNVAISDGTVTVGDVKIADNTITGLTESDDETAAATVGQLNAVSGDVGALTGKVGDLQYDTDHYVTKGDSLTTAVGKLDKQVYSNTTEIDKLHAAGVNAGSVGDIAGQLTGNGGTSIAMGNGSNAGFGGKVTIPDNIPIIGGKEVTVPTTSVGNTAIGAGAQANVLPGKVDIELEGWKPNIKVEMYNNGTALGAAAVVQANNSVALGAGSLADEENTVSVGSSGLIGDLGAFQRKVVNVADGTIEKGSHDAVTGGQLYETNEQVRAHDGNLDYLNHYTGLGTKLTNGAENLADGINQNTAAIKDAATEAAKHTTVSTKTGNIIIQPTENADGSMNYDVALSDAIDVDDIRANTATLGGVQFTGEGKITNVAAGEKDTDAVNVSQLKTTVGEATKGVVYWDDKDESKHTIQGVKLEDGSITAADGNFTVAADGTLHAEAGNSQLNVSKDGAGLSFGDTASVAVSDGKAAISAGGSTIITTADGSAFTNANGATTINGSSITTGIIHAGGITINNDGRITGVKDGVNDTDAVNKSQLDAVAGVAKQHSTVSVNNKTEDGNLVLEETENADGSKNYDVSLADTLKLSETGSLSVGSTALTNGSLMGLSNTTFDFGKYNSGVYTGAEAGYAATQGQLADAFGWLNNKIDSIDVTGSDGNITVDKNEGTKPGEDTGSGSGSTNPQGPTFDLGLNKDKIDLGNVTIEGNNGNITANGTISAGKTSISDDGVKVGDKTSLTETGLTVGGKEYIGENGLNANDQKITNVAEGTEKGDAVNYGQLQNVQDQVTGNSNAIGELGRSVNKLGGEIDSVGAISAALAGLHPLDYDPTNSKYQLSAALGSYDGSSAVAFGGFYNINKDILLSAGVSTVLKGERKTAGNLGVTFRVGSGSSGEAAAAANLKEANQQLAALRQDNKVLATKNDKLTEALSAQGEKLNAQGEELAALKAQVEALLKGTQPAKTAEVKEAKTEAKAETKAEVNTEAKAEAADVKADTKAAETDKK